MRLKEAEEKKLTQSRKEAKPQRKSSRKAAKKQSCKESQSRFSFAALLLCGFA